VIETLERIGKLRLVPLVVLDNAEQAAALGDALIEGGLPIVEIAFRTAAAEPALCELARRGDLLVGAGTVLTTEQADQAIDAGAQFIVAPGTNPKVVEHVLKRGMLMAPGVATPTDIELAMSLGVTSMKFFPAETMGGVATLKSLAGPYPDIRFLPAGGIAPETLPQYLRLKSVIACGGSWLAPRDLLVAGNFHEIQARIQRAVQLLAKIH
jgi:2-dehydro-3-deoxyphosphogluconate aldolase/(4S)-4-hydroxy-2-oxoglutarate aldolase